jgi:hypothetical protein
MTSTAYQPIEQVKTASPSLNPRRDDYLSSLLDSLTLKFGMIILSCH